MLFCGSSHVHSSLWIIDTPVLSKDTIDENIWFVDAFIKTCVVDVSKDGEL